MMSFKQFVEKAGGLIPYPEINRVIIQGVGESEIELHESRKWINGRFDRNIGVDQPTHGAGQVHAHVYGRKKGELVVIVNLDGTGSHGTKGRLSKDDAEALTKRGFNIPTTRIIEWTNLPEQPKVLLLE